MWRIKDFIANTFLKIRLFYLIKFKPSIFINVINPHNKDGWTLTFNDDFNTNIIDTSKWLTLPYYGRRYHEGSIIDDDVAPLVYYSDDMFGYTNNTIIQKVIKEDTKISHYTWGNQYIGDYTIPFKTAMLDSSKSFEQKYGYFEIRSRTEDIPGSWSAFWLASTKSWPPEVDIYEIYTDKNRDSNNIFESNFHWIPKNKHNSNKKMNMHKHIVNNVSDFHIYALEWDENKFKIYYDNILVRVLSNPDILKAFEYPMHIIINNNLQPKFSDLNIFPNHEIDYVRAYISN